MLTGRNDPRGQAPWSPKEGDTAGPRLPNISKPDTARIFSKENAQGGTQTSRSVTRARTGAVMEGSALGHWARPADRRGFCRAAEEAGALPGGRAGMHGVAERDEPEGNACDDDYGVQVCGTGCSMAGDRRAERRGTRWLYEGRADKVLRESDRIRLMAIAGVPATAVGNGAGAGAFVLQFYRPDASVAGDVRLS